MMVFRKSEELSTAMIARGFRPGEERTEYVTLTFTRADCCTMSVVMVAVCLSRSLVSAGKLSNPIPPEVPLVSRIKS